MKKLFQLAAVLLTVVILGSCAGTTSPEKVAEKFVNHLNKREYAEAKALGTESTAQMVSFLEQFPSDEAVEDIIVEDMNCEITGDTAICTYTANGEKETIELVKKDDKWLVDMKKEMPEGDDFSLDLENDTLVE